ncbi:hypothetical protein FGIG_11850 [Fasciola gigantica]|uniref:Phosphatidylinositol-glycan biosynthesis class W protein n=1 Tax=Fasciola gigantica TaxID=46835 RepID=A0A504Z0J5_FASGI|nr:hypothetical protein FGIG_11850 [Fasciola gigantica]
MCRIVLPSLLIGLIRFVCVSLLGYQSVVEEYGVHWNFFITFALVRLASSLICTPWAGVNLSVTRYPPSALIDVISSHGMFYFIACNISTGLVNLCYNTVLFVPSDAVLDRYAGVYSIEWHMIWPQLLIAVIYSSLTLLLTMVYGLKCGKPHSLK